MKTKLDKLKELLEKALYYNNMAPFPVYDTDMVKNLMIKINDMEKNHSEYDEEPVEACSHCDSLHIVMDDIGNNVCFKCGSVNDLTVYKTIYEYKEKTNNEGSEQE